MQHKEILISFKLASAIYICHISLTFFICSHYCSNTLPAFWHFDALLLAFVVGDTSWYHFACRIIADPFLALLQLRVMSGQTPRSDGMDTGDGPGDISVPGHARHESKAEKRARRARSATAAGRSDRTTSPAPSVSPCTERTASHDVPGASSGDTVTGSTGQVLSGLPNPAGTAGNAEYIEFYVL